MKVLNDDEATGDRVQQGITKVQNEHAAHVREVFRSKYPIKNHPGYIMTMVFILYLITSSEVGNLTHSRHSFTLTASKKIIELKKLLR